MQEHDGSVIPVKHGTDKYQNVSDIGSINTNLILDEAKFMYKPKIDSSTFQTPANTTSTMNAEYPIKSKEIQGLSP